MTETLSNAQARRLIIRSQCLDSRRRIGRGASGVLAAVEHLGYIQIDTLSVVERAHLHTLWNRVNGFESAHIDQLQQEGKVFEHWAHALAYMPMQHFRYSLPMKKRLADGERHWYPKDSKITKSVLARIREEGPLSAKDFTDKKTSDAMWARSPSKNALEQLFMEGELMVRERINFHKVYDLTERVLPAHIDTSYPGPEELARHLVLQFIQANSVGQAKEIAYLRKGLAEPIKKAIEQLVEDGTLYNVAIDGVNYVCSKQALSEADKPLPSGLVRILSPFDNATIQRKRLQELFDYDYQIECYVPKAKRQFGYFCLPILFNSKLVARMDAKADRGAGIFHVYQLHIEKPIPNIDGFYEKLLRELTRFAGFNGCRKVKLHKVLGAMKPNWR